MLTSVSEITYSTNNTSTASVYSVGGGVLDAPLETDNFAKSILGNNCKKVDITANGVLNVGDDDLGVPNMNTYSMNSTTNSSTLFSMEVDAIGNMTKFNGYDFNWNGRRLESISQNGVELISYKYNIDGQRVSKTVGNTTTEYFYNGDILAGQKTGNDVLIFMYDNNGEVFGFEYNGTPYYYIKNAQNDVYMIVDETGVAYVLYMYDAWGRVACYDGTDFGLATINPLMYRSYYIDVETGYFFYYLNSRYYLADLGRFVSADSVVSEVGGDVLGYNMFAYCQNNPVNMSDEDGNWPKWIASISKTISNAVKKAVNTVVNVVKSFSSSSRKASMVVASINSLPRTGDPNSSQTLPNPDGTPKQKRWYGPDGSAVRDRDYNHSGDDVTFPHDHEWKDGKRGKEHLEPDPEYKFSNEQIIGLGVVLVCAVGITFVVANDSTGIGIIDDFLLGPLGTGASAGLKLMFSV